jgi:[acyl-carrier-protein] S-malonyltransferase
MLAHEADRRGLAVSGPLRGMDRLALGSAAAAALASSPHATAVFGAVTGGVSVAPAEVDACRAANPELTGEELRLVRHTRADRPVNGGRPYLTRRGDLRGDLVFAARLGTVVAAGPDRLEVLDVTSTAGPDLAATLLAAARSRAFARWLDVQLRDRVVLAPGFEHPGDPAQPDHTHRH